MLRFYIFLLLLITPLFQLYAQNYDQNGIKDDPQLCESDFVLVEKDSVQLVGGHKFLATYSVVNFMDNYSCWARMEQLAGHVMGSNTFGSVYFFILPSSKIPKIAEVNYDFSIFGKNLVGEYRVLPSQKPVLKHYPNTQY